MNNNADESSLADTNKESFLSGSNLGPVINLSNYKLTQPMIELLSKGLNFCPTPKEPERYLLRRGLDKFHVSLRRKLFFERSSSLDQEISQINQDHLEPQLSEEDPPFEHYKFKNPSLWNPQGPLNLEAFISFNELKLNEYKFQKPSHSNLMDRENKALAELKKAQNIIIKPADKGSAVVIQDLDDYINEGYRQLSDSKFYRETKDDLTILHNELITSLINHLEDNKEISKKCGAYLRNSSPRTSQLYLLPKVHKKKLPMPGRPIVSANNSPTEKISELADHFLKPLVQTTKSYVKDTTDFINKIEALPTLSETAILCTIDVTSLYTNIPNSEGISACKNLLDLHRDNSEKPSNDNIIHLLEYVLHMNNFDFNDKHYLQVGGTAMGTRVAPSFANIFMADFEEKFVYNYHDQPFIWLRYIDDIFMIWNHGKQTLDNFLHHLNSCHHSIKFTVETSTTSLPFLDTQVKINQDRSIYTDLYCKPTDAHNYLLFNSSHPKHLMRSLPYSQLLRIRRICTHMEDFDKNAKMIGQHFIRRLYPEDLIIDATLKARRKNRQELLQPNHTSQEVNKNRHFVVSPFDPTCDPLRDIINDTWPLLGRTNTTESVYDNRPTFGYRRTSNLKDILVSAKIQSDSTSEETIRLRNINRLCKARTCRYCPRLNKTGQISNPHTGDTFPTKTNITCNSNNLIYCIECTICSKLYVGQTKNTIKERFKSHFYGINNPAHQDTTVSRHYSRPDHDGIKSLTIFVLDFITSPQNSTSGKRLRDERELFWIHRLSSIAPLGLNSAD
jgi:peptide-methionine (R)-S-oxide reductase